MDKFIFVHLLFVFFCILRTSALMFLPRFLHSVVVVIKGHIAYVIKLNNI